MKIVVAQKQSYSNRGFMKRATKIIACIAVSAASLCHASTDPECLKHLGGAFGDVECFNRLSNDLKQENKKLAESIASSIPNGNSNKALFKTYLRNQASAQSFCELSRQAMTNWVREAKTANPRYHDYDVAYYECVYVLLEQENKFLKSLSKSVNQE